MIVGGGGMDDEVRYLGEMDGWVIYRSTREVS